MGNKSREAVVIAKEFIRVLRENRIRVEKAYLYGSFVYGVPHKDSDIDLCIVSPQFSTRSRRDHLRLAKLRRGIDLRISALPYHPKDFTDEYTIPYEAMTKGIRVA